MTEAPHADLAAPRPRNVRREDGFIYKGMAGLIYSFVAMVFVARFTLRAEEGAFAIMFLLALLLFDIGWDLAMRASGHVDMLNSNSTPAILAKALGRFAYVGAMMIALTYAQQNSTHLAYVILCFAAWWAAEALAKGADW